MTGAESSFGQRIGELAKHPLAVPAIVVAADCLGIGQELECAMRIPRTVYQVADGQHADRIMFREQSSRGLEGKILTVNVAKDADLSGE